MTGITLMVGSEYNPSVKVKASRQQIIERYMSDESFANICFDGADQYGSDDPEFMIRFTVNGWVLWAAIEPDGTRSIVEPIRS